MRVTSPSTRPEGLAQGSGEAVMTKPRTEPVGSFGTDRFGRSEGDCEAPCLSQGRRGGDSDPWRGILPSVGLTAHEVSIWERGGGAVMTERRSD